MTGSPYRRIIRRETHSPRSALAIVIAVILGLAAALLGTESVLRVLGVPPLLFSPADAAQTVADASSSPLGILVAGGIVTALFGLFLIIAAVSPGHRAKHSFTTDRSAVVMDDEIIASSLARQAAHAGGVSPDGAVVTVGRRRATVVLRPSSGYRVDSDAVRKASEAELSRIAAIPTVTLRIAIAENGRVGS